MSAVPSEQTIGFSLDGKTLEALPGETILEAAKRRGIEIPHLCYTPGMRADGNCRACMVEIEGERVLAPSCCRAPKAGMKVKADSVRARAAQKMVLELLRSDMPEEPLRADSELDTWSRKLGLGKPRFGARGRVASDASHPGIAVDLNACIQCTRCVRACREVQVNDVIGYAFRGAHSGIVFDFGDPMGESSCVGCGECVQACPTGALLEKSLTARPVAEKSVDSLCPYCGVGCQVTYKVQERRIIAVEGRDGPANHGRLCVKGRFGYDYARHSHRLTKPLIRREGKPKRMALDPGNPYEVFREASWDEALEFAASGLKRIREQHGRYALAGFGSAKGSNEEAYLFQKLVRAGFGSNNVDHCTRLCHASSVAALLECIGSGAVSNPVSDVQYAEVIIVIGANPTINHPVAATFMKNAVECGAKLVVMDPRENDLARHATHFLQFRSDTDVALLNAMMHAIVEEGLADEAFIARRTEGFEAFRDNLRHFAPEAMAGVCGIDAETIRAVARLYAKSKASIIFWGMGISQHVHGTDNARCLIALALMTGQIGRRGTGLHPLRGQNNVQGASDIGLIPMMLPDYHRTTDDAARAHCEEVWGLKPGTLDSKPGLTVVEIMHAAKRGEIRGMYIEGENPAMSDPDLNHAREALACLEHLVVQDLFLTETAMFADVVLPASAFAEKTGTFTNTDRCVQLGRQALRLPGEARQDLWIIQEIARRVDTTSGARWDYTGPDEVFGEMRKVMNSIAGVTWQRLERESAVTYPCTFEGDASHEVIFTETFPTASGRGRFVPAKLLTADEVPDDAYPSVLITGRELEHWHTGAMTRRSRVLDALEPEAYVAVNPGDLSLLGIEAGELVTLETRRGSVSAKARADSGLAPGTVFMPFCYVEAAANILTNPALDPFGKIPEFKYCAVRVRPVPLGGAR
jgi:formate dehydrogenase major subunit